jgi:hypothetical protein
MSIPNPYASVGVPTPTTSTTTCVPTYVSITLNAGNSFVLPPGATLVAATDKDLLQTDCVDLDGLEELTCYLFYYNVQSNDNTLEDPNETVQILGIVIDGVFYEFTTSVTDEGLDGATTNFTLFSQYTAGLESVSLNGLISNITVFTQNNQNVSTRVFCFKTVPSIAKKMQVKIYDATIQVVNPYYLLPLFTWDEIVDNGDIPLDTGLESACSCGPDYNPTTPTTTAPVVVVN